MPPSVGEYSQQFGSSLVSLNHNPIDYAKRLCKLVNKEQSKHMDCNEVHTLDNLPSIIRKIYLKIREQLEDRSHPIIWIISKFQIAFKHDIEEKLAEI